MADLDLLVSFVTTSLGPIGSWADEPVGWPNEIGAALVDAVFSANARYGSPTSGVRRVVSEWRTEVGGLGDLSSLVSKVADRGGPAAVADLVGNHQKVPGRSADRPLKAAATVAVAEALLDTKIRRSSHLVDRPDVRAAVTSVSGVGDVTYSYLLMLSGVQDVKADRMIRRFVEGAIHRKPTSEEARVLMNAAAASLGVPARQLDHVAWRWQRGRSSRA